MLFVCSGWLAPLVHDLHHAAEWHEQQEREALLDPHEHPDYTALGEHCDWVQDLQAPCLLCVTSSLRAVLAEDALHAFNLPQAYLSSFISFSTSTANSLQGIRGPPVRFV